MIAIRRVSVLLLIIVVLNLQIASAANLAQSSQNEIFENPFIVTGFNPNTNILTGYVALLRTSPGRTDECKFVFSGQVEKTNSLIVFVKDAVKSQLSEANESPKITKGEFTSNLKQKKLILHKNALPGDCDWIFPFANDAKVVKNGEIYSILVDDGEIGKWLAVSVIRSRRAYFFKEPNSSNSSKVFLIAGDLAYVYDEKPDWYFVKFQGRKKETVGWIKKSDTIQFP